MSLFDKMLEDEKYRQLFDELPNDQRPIIMDAMRKLVEQIENVIIKPVLENPVKK